MSTDFKSVVYTNFTKQAFKERIAPILTFFLFFFRKATIYGVAQALHFIGGCARTCTTSNEVQDVTPKVTQSKLTPYGAVHNLWYCAAP